MIQRVIKKWIVVQVDPLLIQRDKGIINHYQQLIYSYFSSELDKDFTHEFINLRLNRIIKNKFIQL